MAEREALIRPKEARAVQPERPQPAATRAPSLSMFGRQAPAPQEYTSIFADEGFREQVNQGALIKAAYYPIKDLLDIGDFKGAAEALKQLEGEMFKGVLKWILGSAGKATNPSVTLEQLTGNLEGSQKQIAHEVWHTAQQAGGLVQAGIDRSASLETEAQGKGSELSSDDVQTASSLALELGLSAQSAPVEIDGAGGASGHKLVRAYLLARLYQLRQTSPAENRELRALIENLLDTNAFANALQEVPSFNANLSRAEVLRVLMASEALGVYRTRMTVEALGGLEQVTFDAFVEQLSSFMAYSNTLDFSDLNNPSDSKSGAAKLLQSFGYKATPAIHGAWGLQMMVFTPLPAQAKDAQQAKYTQNILAFRGTQGVKQPTNPAANAAAARGNPDAFRKDNESELDTATDFALADIAYTQFDTNRALIAEVVARATTGAGGAVAAGHSLGGALAQITAARFPRFGQLLTFQAPHVKLEDIKRLEAQQKLRSMNYRMNWDVVPRGGPQPRMAGEVAVFEDANNPLAQHHTPMLSELLEQTGQDGGALTPQQAALVNAGKQPPNELNEPGRDANTVRLQQLIPGKADATVVAQGGALFAGQNLNVVANNLLVNVLREMLLPKLEGLTSVNIRKNGGVETLLERLNDQRRRVGQQESIDEARARPFSKESQGILEAYGDAASLFSSDVVELKAMRDSLNKSLGQKRSNVNAMTPLNFVQRSAALIALHGTEGTIKLIEVALWWKTGQDTQDVTNILDATRRMTSQDLGRWWYSANLDGEDLYRALVTRTAGSDQPYL